jgi:RNA polymerase sigma factor (sigma-70 family)
VSRYDDPVFYVRRVMVNSRLKSYRYRNREVVTDPEELPHCCQPPFEAAADTRQELTSALRTLTLGERRVIALRYFADLTEAQTADLLGCSVGTVKSQTARAMRRLRGVLAAHEGTTPHQERSDVR